MLTANYHYSRSNRENLPLQIHIKLSEKQKIFCATFFYIIRIALNFQWSEKNYFDGSRISEVIDSEICASGNA